MDWIKINGCDFHREVATFSIERFELEFKHSFCLDRSVEECHDVLGQIKAHFNGTDMETVKELKAEARKKEAEFKKLRAADKVPPPGEVAKEEDQPEKE